MPRPESIHENQRCRCAAASLSMSIIKKWGVGFIFCNFVFNLNRNNLSWTKKKVMVLVYTSKFVLRLILKSSTTMAWEISFIKKVDQGTNASRPLPFLRTLPNSALINVCYPKSCHFHQQEHSRSEPKECGQRTSMSEVRKHSKISMKVGCEVVTRHQL